VRARARLQQLYDFAEQLVLQGDAYVCAQTKAEVKASRDLLKQFHIQCGKAGMTREQKRATPLPDGAESPCVCAACKMKTTPCSTACACSLSRLCGFFF
jgi:glutamyl/glutaminyl-tRNA synthetase